MSRPHYDKHTIEVALTPALRTAVFRSLGVGPADSVTPDKMNEDGWVTGLYLPESVKKDNNPDLSVNLHSGFFNDFGSSLNGTIYDLAMLAKDLDLDGAIAYVAETAAQHGLSEYAYADHAARREEFVATLPAMKRLTAPLLKQASARLLTGTDADAERARVYLTKRRALSEDTLRKNLIGLLRFQTPRWYMANVLKWPEDRVEQSGASGLDDPLEWICFPMRSEGDRLTHYKMVAFDGHAGRWYDAGSGKKLVLTNGAALLYPTSPACRPTRHKELVLCEGEIDALTLAQAGIPALTGTAGSGTFYDRWAQEIAEIAPKVVMAFDADESGRAGADRAAGMLLTAGLAVHVAQLPEGTDVNTLVAMNEGRMLREAIRKAEAATVRPTPSRRGPRATHEPAKMLNALEIAWGGMDQNERDQCVKLMLRILATEGKVLAHG